MDEGCSEQVQEEEMVLRLQDAEIVGVDVICRLCANQSDKIIGIYSEEGVTNDLANKMNLYLPIKVSESDNLPLQCCWTCASTVLAWHELVLASVEADRRLRNELVVTTAEEDSQLKEMASAEDTGINYEGHTDDIESDPDDNKPTPPPDESLGEIFCQTKHEGSSSPILPVDDSTINDGEEEDEDPNCEGREEALNKIFIKSEEYDDEYFSGMLDESKKEDGETDTLTDADKAQKKSAKLYRCQFCSRTSSVEMEIVMHIRQDHVVELSAVNIDKNRGGRRRKYTKVDQEAILKAKIEVDGRVYYNCKDCGKSLHSPYTYLWHRRIHTGERPFTCHLCGKQFRVSQGLVRHLRETHEGVKNYPCDLCGRMFASKRNVEEHRRIHTNERPYICDLCGKTFKQKASLFVHNRSHTSVFRFRCSYCNQGFRAKGPLLVHVTKHTGEKPFPCETCGRCFRIKYELKRHQLIHSDDKPFACPDCGDRFRQKRYLKNHQKINHNLF